MVDHLCRAFAIFDIRFRDFDEPFRKIENADLRKGIQLSLHCRRAVWVDRHRARQRAKPNAMRQHLSLVGAVDIEGLLTLQGSRTEKLRIDAEWLVPNLDGKRLPQPQFSADSFPFNQCGRVAVDLLDLRQCLFGPAEGGHERVLFWLVRPSRASPDFSLGITFQPAEVRCPTGRLCIAKGY